MTDKTPTDEKLERRPVRRDRWLPRAARSLRSRGNAGRRTTPKSSVDQALALPDVREESIQRAAARFAGRARLDTERARGFRDEVAGPVVRGACALMSRVDACKLVGGLPRARALHAGMTDLAGAAEDAGGRLLAEDPGDVWVLQGGHEGSLRRSSAEIKVLGPHPS